MVGKSKIIALSFDYSKRFRVRYAIILIIVGLKAKDSFWPSVIHKDLPISNAMESSTRGFEYASVLSKLLPQMFRCNNPGLFMGLADLDYNHEEAVAGRHAQSMFLHLRLVESQTI